MFTCYCRPFPTCCSCILAIAALLCLPTSRGRYCCCCRSRRVQSRSMDNFPGLGCIFLQESSGFLCFPFLWHFFHRNQDSCSAVTFSEHHQETCLYGAYVESYVGYQFVRQKQRVLSSSLGKKSVASSDMSCRWQC